MLASGSGSTLQALLDAAPASSYDVVAVGSDKPAARALERAAQAGVPTFTCALSDSPTRDQWNFALAGEVERHAPDLVVCAGFMRILSADFLTRFAGRVVNTHPALLPSFPGAHAVADALAYGVRVSGVTVHFVDEGVDTGPVIAQAAVPVRDDDDELSLQTRIQDVERPLYVEAIDRLAREGWTVQGRTVRFG
ncbi:MAG: phosphoribosylglycinamide formyltransferase [Frankiales bacterium]|nr:phosphoribosylglycinamide formyltransferase [Frankiales bacterium]